MFHPSELIEWTNQAMLYELMTEPSFGRVTPSTAGAHHDMDHLTFIDSLSVLNRYFLKMAEACFNRRDLMDDYDTIVSVGMECEEAMFRKTQGVNTHKGTIFVLGTLVACTSKVLANNGTYPEIFRLVKRFGEEKWKELQRLQVPKSNGERLYVKGGYGGVREEARKGFPLIQQAVEWIDIRDPKTFTITLMRLMAECEDTTILHRHGDDVLRDVQETMRRALKEAKTKETLNEISEAFIKRGISPGGSADLLIGTFFMRFIKDHYFMNEIDG